MALDDWVNPYRRSSTGATITALVLAGERLVDGILFSQAVRDEVRAAGSP
jgi:hypothetical protein